MGRRVECWRQRKWNIRLPEDKVQTLPSTELRIIPMKLDEEQR
jgi:hypothetical protein